LEIAIYSCGVTDMPAVYSVSHWQLICCPQAGSHCQRRRVYSKNL